MPPRISFNRSGVYAVSPGSRKYPCPNKFLTLSGVYAISPGYLRKRAVNLVLSGPQCRRHAAEGMGPGTARTLGCERRSLALSEHNTVTKPWSSNGSALEGYPWLCCILTL